MANTTATPIPTPTYDGGGSFTISCSSRIAATPQDCLAVVTKSSDYATWNRFCRKCTIDSQPTTNEADPETLRLGTQFTFDVHLNSDEPDGSAGQAIALEVSVLEPIDEDAKDSVFVSSSLPPRDADAHRTGWRIAWRQRPSLRMPSWMLRSERVQEFVDVNGGSETEYHCWETFYGLLAPVVKLAVGKQVEKGFDAWLVGLKGRVEKGGQVAQ
ncbi:hypothetical protein C8A00DRAFT_12132 [Chaetomidium leptoderma]|uniref:Polyketide cyclase/dehydrase n=1 Tax=Chaetomidium leptoderma TaxID=669021 RepID=A0AAN7A1N6_9PEZI|nr:hypothetical protein C8A00DRAFT_12132 [Chaetomidium leptoderma]